MVGLLGKMVNEWRCNKFKTTNQVYAVMGGGWHRDAVGSTEAPVQC